MLADAAVRTAVLGATFGLNHIGLATGAALFPGLPDVAKSIVENVSVTRQRLDSRKVSKPRKRVLKNHMTEQLKTLEALAAGEARAKKAASLRATLRKAAPARDGRARFVIRADVKQIWSSAAIALLARKPGTSIVSPLPGDDETLLMLEFADGLFAPVWLYPDLVGTLLRDVDGVAAINYSQIYGDEDGKGLAAAATAISRLVTGRLSVDEVDRLATQLRREKHVNPVFGAIAAYCYDVAGDLNSIRRMAAFYAQRGQAAPYDIVFLGMIDNDGTRARVPELPQDTRRRPGDPPRWLVTSMPAIDARIAGRCPWLRQGWDFLSTPGDAELPMVAGLDQFRNALTPSVFTTLKPQGGAALVAQWGLRPSLAV